MINVNDMNASEQNQQINISERMRASKVAMLVPRAIALVLDVLCIVSSIAAFNWVTGLGKTPNDALALLAMAAALSYFIIAEWRWGRTLGKWAVGIVVVNKHGLPISLLQSIVRNVLRPLEAIPGPSSLVGAAAILLTRDSQRIGDMMASVYVVPKHLLAPARNQPA